MICSREIKEPAHQHRQKQSFDLKKLETKTTKYNF